MKCIFQLHTSLTRLELHFVLYKEASLPLNGTTILMYPYALINSSNAKNDMINHVIIKHVLLFLFSKVKIMI